MSMCVSPPIVERLSREVARRGGLLPTAGVLLLMLLSIQARAQLSGSASVGGEATNNVESLNTTAPDDLILPAFELNYTWQIGGASKLEFTGSYSPNIYTVNAPLSFNATTLGVTGQFYLSHLDAIAAETAAESSGNTNRLQRLPFDFGPARIMSIPRMLGTTPLTAMEIRSPMPPVSNVNDSLVDVAVSALYTLSGQLDSTDIATKGLSKTRVQEFEDLRDSISDVLSTIADLLDSTGYSESAAQIVLPELEHARAPLARLMPQTKLSHTDPSLLDAAIAALRQAKPESDFLTTVPVPSASNETPSAAKKVIEALQQPALGQREKETEASAPALTLLTSSTRLREFSASDASVHEDVEDSGATTLATLLTIPISWSAHTGTNYSPADSTADNNLFGGVFPGNPNDYHSVSFGAAIEGLTSESFALRGSYDYTRATYAFDSVYSNSENRFELLPRLAAGRSTVFFGELSIGFRNYLNPLRISDTVRNLRGKNVRIDSQVAASKFNQFSYGLGIAQFIGERWVIGVLAAFNNNPNLRAYVTTAQVQTIGKGRIVRAAVQIADDEYTYNLSRYSLFSNARIFWDMDVGSDLSYEQRTYGSAVGPKGNTIPGGQGRTESGWFFNASLSKLFSFESRLISVFNSSMLEGRMEIASVTASQSLYSYEALSFTVTATLGF